MSAPRQYLDFPIQIDPIPGATWAYKVQIVPGPHQGEIAPRQVHIPLEELRPQVTDLEDKKVADHAVTSLGERLSTYLLPEGSIRDRFIQSVREAETHQGVRIRLMLQDPVLGELPWELVHLPIYPADHPRNHFLVLNPQVSLVRHTPSPRSWPAAQRSDQNNLRLLAAFASPKGLTPLNLDLEKRILEGALGSFKVDGIGIEWKPILERATHSSLTERLIQKADIFHFSGHGGLLTHPSDPSTTSGIAEGHLAVVGEDGAFSLLSAGDLAPQLQAAGVRLAYLGACETARIDGRSPWSGMATALISRGLPSVVAMQFEIQDSAAIQFCRLFYTALAAGLSIDEAVSAGRLGIMADSAASQLEWGVPVLYSRTPDGMLFPGLKPEASRDRDQVTLAIEQTTKVIEEGGQVVGIQASRLPDGSFKITQKADQVNGTMIGLNLDEL